MAFRTNIMPVLQEKSASGAVATFNTALAMPLSSCNIAVNAWQEGSGDPSPSNVRAIHGFSEVNLTANNAIYTIQLGQDVYGGSYNSESGKLTLDIYKPDISNRTFTIAERDNGGYYFQHDSSTLPICAYGASEGVAIRATELFNMGAIDNPKITNINCAFIYRSGISRTVIRIGFVDVQTIEDFNSIKSNIQLVYRLQTPIEIQLTPTQIETLIGNNTIFADTGDVDLTYKDLDIAKRGNFREVFKLPS